jgi:glutamate dehydrogenase/leucine dehydrogenase
VLEEEKLDLCLVNIKTEKWIYRNFDGKGLSLGGSLIRPEATGYGNVYCSKHAGN